MLSRPLAVPHGVSPTAGLVGATRRQIEAAVRRGELVRPRRGWIAAADADPGLISAVRVGGALSCTSLLSRRGVWCADDDRLHVRVAPNTGHLGAPDARSEPLTPAHPVTVHRPASLPIVAAAADDPLCALAVATVCQQRLDAVVSLDSALHQGFVTLDAVRLILARLPQRYHELIDWVDPQSASGLETKARLRLRRWNIRIRSQVKIDGVGHVDLLLGDLLVVEVDGYTWHSTRSAFAEDRRRDLELTRQGYRVVRLSYEQVMFGWPECERVLLQLVRRRAHLRR
jgi:very-short-patch-repair endonuclease